MIYVSIGHFKNRPVTQSVELLAQSGFKNIELSGGEYHRDIEEDLLALKNRYSLNLICHNYFPPSREPFVLNLASLDDGIFHKTLEFLMGAVSLSRRLGARMFGFHAGFFYDVPVEQLGDRFRRASLSNKEQCLKRFCEGFLAVQASAPGIGIYVENNVISSRNLKEFKGENPLMLSCLNDYRELKERIDFNLLLDVGHLKVSTASLKKDFGEELTALCSRSDYIHLSDNDGCLDGHAPIEANGELCKILKTVNLKGKTVTLELADDVRSIQESYDLIREYADA
ncbi:MAG: TIM barrel protein [Candidatus Omnitrophota bacterium]